MSIEQEKTSAEVREAEQEAKSSKDAIYIKILISLGVISLLMAVIIIIARDMQTSAQTNAIFLMSILLLVMGGVWQQRDKKQVEKAKEKYEKLTEEEARGIRIR
ncbi:hypothetical protein GF367_03020 [Candidatus Woesearchaeota archaeon]|nr:hypothetical protein [Candidatus Woesearchaeota archaeon]